MRLMSFVLVGLLLSFPAVAEETVTPQDTSPHPSPDPSEPTLEQAEKVRKKRFFGAYLGQAIVLSGNKGNYFMFGARLGTELFQDHSGKLAIAASFWSSSNKTTANGVTADGTITPVMVELFTREIYGSGLYLGGRLGISFHSLEIVAGGVTANGSGSAFAVGPLLGYQFQLNQQASFALDFSWTSIAKSTLNFAGIGSFEANSISALTIQGGAVFDF